MLELPYPVFYFLCGFTSLAFANTGFHMLVSIDCLVNQWIAAANNGKCYHQLPDQEDRIRREQTTVWPGMNRVVPLMFCRCCCCKTSGW